MRRWQQLNIALAVIVSILLVAAGVKFGFGVWSEHTIQREKTVVGTPTVAGNAISSPKLQIDGFRYYYAQDFLKRPTLVVSYRITNDGNSVALPQYVFDNTVTFVQQTDAGTNSILAQTTVPKTRLSFLNQNYQENGQIQLKKHQKARVIATYRMESRNRPLTLMVDGKKREQLEPWTMKAVATYDDD